MLAAFFHAAALTGRSLDGADRLGGPAGLGRARRSEILRRHPMAEPHMAEQLASALFNTDPRTAGNTRTTVHQAMEPFLQSARSGPGSPRASEHPATDIAEVLRRGGTIFLLGREDPYSSATPLMTAVAEHVIDTARRLAETSPLAPARAVDAVRARRAALDRADPEPAGQHGQRPGAGHRLPVGQPDPPAAVSPPTAARPPSR